MAHLPTLVALCVAAGTLAGVWWPLHGATAAWAGLAAALLAGACYWRGYGSALVVAAGVGIAALSCARAASAFSAAATPTLVAALSAAGLLAGDTPRPRPAVTMRGTLSGDAVVQGPTVLLRLNVSRAAYGSCGCPLPLEGPVLLAVAGEHAAQQAGQWRAGRTLTATGALRRPVSYRNLGAPDAAHDLVRRRLALTGSVKSALLVEDLAPGPWLSEAAAVVRARARVAIARAAGTDAAEAAAIGTAVLIGDRAGLDPALIARLQRAGTFHVIAISGGNIALLTVIAVWGCGWLLGHGRLTFVVAAVVLVGYAVVVGGGASVLRATGMAVVGLAARTLDQRGAAISVLALTGAALLVADPLIAVDTGFWLTTAATAGLIVGLGEREPSTARWPHLLRMLVFTSLWAELGLLPIVASAFQQVTVAGVLLSAIAIPGMALVQMAAMLAVAADVAVPWLLPVAGIGLRAGTTVVVESARVADWLPLLSWRVPPPHAAAVAGYYGAVALWLWVRVADAGAGRARLRPLARGLVAAMVVWVAIAPASLVVWPRTHVEMVALDVGQGDATLLRFANGRTMLVDAGGRGGSGFDVGARVVGPALRARGVRWLDYLVVTHADADHIGGAVSMVEEFQPREVWTGVPVADDAATAALRRAADAAGATWRVVQRGDTTSIGGADVQVVHPPLADWERQRVRNDDSVVLVVRVGTVRLILTGDIGAEVDAEVAAEIARAGDSSSPGVRVLKVAHHGSAGATSPVFLQSVRPAIAVVSAGVDDPFGHPAAVILDRLAQADVAIARTDRDGAVAVRTDGYEVVVQPFSGSARRWLLPLRRLP